MKTSFALVFLVGFTWAQSCVPFTCGTLDYGKCVSQINNNAVTVQPCPSGQFCSGVFNPLTGAGYLGTIHTITSQELSCFNSPAPIPVIPGSVMTGDTCSYDTDCKTSGS